MRDRMASSPRTTIIDSPGDDQFLWEGMREVANAAI